MDPLFNHSPIFLLTWTHHTRGTHAETAPGMKVSDIEKYLRTDSTHTYDHSAVNFSVLDECTFSINEQIIFLLGERDAAMLDWPKYDINYVIDATGVYLTTSKAQAHNVDYVIMCAPPKDDKVTPQFVVNGNHEKYAGEGMC